MLHLCMLRPNHTEAELAPRVDDWRNAQADIAKGGPGILHMRLPPTFKLPDLNSREPITCPWPGMFHHLDAYARTQRLCGARLKAGLLPPKARKSKTQTKRPRTPMRNGKPWGFRKGRKSPP